MAERKYLLPPEADKQIFEVGDHVYWAATSILKAKYGQFAKRNELRDHIEEVYDDLEKLGYKILVWASECDTLYLRGKNSNLTPLQRRKIQNLAFKLFEEGFAFIVQLEDDFGNFETLVDGTETTIKESVQTESPAFKAWFKNSKVVDENGNPLVCYHVSNSDFLEFKPLSHFGTAGQARSLYYGRASQLGSERKFMTQTYPVYLSIQNPLRVDDMHDNDAYNLLKHINSQLACQYMEELHDFDNKIKNEAKKKDEDEYNKKVKFWRKNRSGSFPTMNYTNVDLVGREFIRMRDYTLPGKYKTIFINEMKKKGYDGLVYLNKYESNNPEADERQAHWPRDLTIVPSASNMKDSYIVLDPSQIKSAIGNKGTFNPTNPNITEKYLPKFTHNKIHSDNNQLRAAYKLIKESTVREYIQTNDYIVHGTDTLEKLKNIILNGLRPKTHVSNSEGQGLESGPYVLVYPKKQFSGEEVAHRPGDYMYTRVKGRPVLILFDIGELGEAPPIEVLEQRYLDAQKKMEDYIEQKYPSCITGKTEYGSVQHDWKKFGELGGFNDRVHKNLETRCRMVGDHYFYALDNSDYKPKTTEDYFNEVKAVAAPFHIPVKKMDYSNQFDDFVFIK